MDFALSEEQELLVGSLRRFLDDELPVARVRELVAEAPGRDGGAWKALAELGIAGLLVPETWGGSGLGLLDAAVAAEALASRVAPTPFLGSAVMAPVALLAGGGDEQRERWLPRLADGSCRIGVAATELVSRRDGAGVELRDGRLFGSALMVLDAPDAACFLVPLDEGKSLALVSAQAEGLAVTPLRSVDRTRGFAELVFAGAPVAEWVGARGEAAEACGRMLRAGRVVLAADILGASGRAIDLAVAYAM